MQESTEIINRILEDSKKEEWRVSNMTSAMEIAEITETFGKELAHKWSNDTSGMVSLDANIGEWIYHLHVPFVLCPIFIYDIEPSVCSELLGNEHFFNTGDCKVAP